MSILEVQAVSKAFGGIQALNNCSLVVEQGTITGLIGPNGSAVQCNYRVRTHRHGRDSLRWKSHLKGDTRQDIWPGHRPDVSTDARLPAPHRAREYACRSPA